MKPDFSIIPEPDRTVEDRKPLTKKQRAEIALRQDGLCGCGCGVKLDHAREGTIDEHWRPLGLLGTNDIETNRRLLRKPCAASKTTVDMRAINKAKRIERKSNKETRPKPKMKSAGFRPKPDGFRYSWGKRKIGG